jgi:hypothetical protein
MLGSVVFLIIVVGLPGAGRLVCLAPLVGALVLLWRSRSTVRPPVLPAAMTAIAALYGCGLVALLLPVDLGAPVLVLAAIGLDLMVLGYLVAVADAVESGERLHPDLRRSATAALAAVLLCAGPAALTVLAAPGVDAVVILQFVLLAVVLGAVGLAAPLRRAMDTVAFLGDDRLRADRAALWQAVDALTRRRQRHRLIATSKEEFIRLTGRALDDFSDDVRLLRSPLVNLPTVDRRLTGPAAEQPMARALELRAVLAESVARLKPDGLFGTSEVWRHYNALFYCRVRGLRPYERRTRTDGLDRDTRRALDWFRRYVPPATLRQWQDEGARMVADRLWEELVRTDPRWLTHSTTGTRPTTTRGSGS